MILRLVLSQLVAMVLGSLVAQLLDRRPKSKAKAAFDLSLGAGFGLGLTSCLFFSGVSYLPKRRGSRS